MLRSLVVATAVLMMLSACTTKYVSSEYELSEDRIPGFDLNGDVTVHNGYAESRPIRFEQFEADLEQVSATFARQLEREIRRNGRQQGGGSDKEIEVRATDLGMANRVAYLEGRINVRLELGNGEVVAFEKRNGSPASPQRVLNGTIARAVMEALRHDTVLAYLAE